MTIKKLVSLSGLLAILTGSIQADPLGTVFTYQGRLDVGTNVGKGTFDLTFTLYDALNGGSVVGTAQTNTAVAISDGLFSVPLDFGSAFGGNARWLEMGVRSNGSGGAFTQLLPRQELTPSPYALYAPNAGNAQTVVNGVYTTGAYADPAWITSLAGTKVAGNISGNAASATTANSFSGSLAGDVTGTQGATVVGTVGSVSAANVASGANAANNATSENTPSTIVRRDASGNFAAQAITLSGNLALPTTAGSSVGVISLGDNPFLHGYGYNNSFVGNEAGNFTMSGGDNTAVGRGALRSNTSGHGNTAVGIFALYNNTNGNHNTACGDDALVLNRSGAYNTACGYAALENNTGGNYNTAVGVSALSDNTNGSYNTAVGVSGLVANRNGNFNTAVGVNALFLNVSGSFNTANGVSALYYNRDGSNNTANGFEALHDNRSGYDNTAVGVNTLYSNTDGFDNTASGNSALYFNTSGSYNTANGYYALAANVLGNYNTAIGYQALWNYSGNGSWNIALGGQAGYNITGGNNNIDLGSPGVAGDDGVIRIGNGNNKAFIAGIFGKSISPSGTTVYINSAGQLATSNSSRRFKEAIRDMGGLSEVLLSLRPVAFRYKADLDPEGASQFGLIAEEVEQVAPELVLRDDQGEVQSVRYEQVNAMLLNEFLKEHRKVEELESRLEKLEQVLDTKSGGGQ